MRLPRALAVATAVLAMAGPAISACSSGSGPGPGSGLESGPHDLPGGKSGKDVLQAHHLLDAKGRVAPGLTAPKESEVKAAICAYVFGTPDQVGVAAKLEGTVTLTPGSGYLYRGGGGSGVECGYDVSGKTAFELVIWDQKADTSSGAEHVVLVNLPDHFEGRSGYAPDYRGDTVSDTTAKRWLREAAERVTHGSV